MQGMQYLTIFMLLLIASIVSAQIDQDILDKQGDICGDNVRDRFELCDDPKGRDPGLCTDAGKLLKIIMVCHPKNCGCIPYKNKDCGNGIREGSEFCDPPSQEDHCGELGQLLSVDLVCNPTSCMCTPAEHVPIGIGAGSQPEEETRPLEEIIPETTAEEKTDDAKELPPEEKEADQQTSPAETSPPPAPLATKEETSIQEPPKPVSSNRGIRIVLGMLLLGVVIFVISIMISKHRKSHKNESLPIDEMEHIDDEEK